MPFMTPTAAALTLTLTMTLTLCALLALTATHISSPALAQTLTFHWGVASSGFQVEGSTPDSNWRRYVARRASGIEDPLLNAVDWYRRYKSDIALAKAMGVNTYRFSVEWARVEPAKGAADATAWAFYDDVVATITGAGMTPMITLDHWVYPGWADDADGWMSSTMLADWTAHVTRVVRRYANRNVLWVTVNEATVYAEKESNLRGYDLIRHAVLLDRLVQAHRRAYDVVHANDPTGLVTSNVAYKPPPLQQLDDAVFFDRVVDKLDFIGIDYYYTAALSDWSVINAASGKFWDVNPIPDGLYYAVMTYHAKAPALPVYIVENGMPTKNGTARADGYTRANHLRDHVYWLQRAAADGVQVLGYNVWSITDNYEWGSYAARFGLYTVDVLTDATLARRATDGVAAYADIIARNGVPSGYTPVKAPSLCILGASISACVGQIKSLLGLPTPSPTTRAPTKRPTTAAPTTWWQGLFGQDAAPPQAEEQAPVVSPAAIAGIAAGALVAVGLAGTLAVVARARRGDARAVAVTQRVSRALGVAVGLGASHGPGGGEAGERTSASLAVVAKGEVAENPMFEPEGEAGARA